MEGREFGRYRLVELLGRGDLGEVWRAHDTETANRTAAIKLLPPQLAADPAIVEQFRREAAAAARLNNPHIVPINDYGEIGEQLYIDMELIDGRNLQEVLADGPIEPARAVRIIGQVADALHAVHEIGLVHGDVKPSNILIDRDDFAYLVDLGIARLAPWYETRLTNSDNEVVSWHYMAPERSGAREADARADIYSLACVLYECLTGQPPFAGDTWLFAAHLSTPPPRPSVTRPGVPPRLDDVIATGMAKDPANRYATTLALADAANDVIAGTTRAPVRARHAAPDGYEQPVPPPQPEPYPAANGNLVQPAPPISSYLADPPPPVTSYLAVEAAPADEPSDLEPFRQPWPDDADTPPRRLWWRRPVIVVPAALATVAAVVLAFVVIVGQFETDHDKQPNQHRDPSYGAQVTLPFNGLGHPADVEVDPAGNIYVADDINNRVLKLAPGSNTAIELPFTGLNSPQGVAGDGAGNLYVADTNNNRVLKLAAGSSTQTVLPFTGLHRPQGVATDEAGALYLADTDANRVLELPAGASTPIELPLTGLNSPEGVGLDKARNVYIADSGNSRVVKLEADSNRQSVVPFSGLFTPGDPSGVAVDSGGDIFVTDYSDNRVLKMEAGSGRQSVLPFVGLNHPSGIAVDKAVNLFVTDYTGDRVVKLPAK
ncbi:MAG: serine/threonine-protein kinase PknD [Actinomycetota bacterium]|uniref:non-specific serine/threonine protein kinase n=1 Tax=Mycobacterium lentiflavum TaxID=141349 RepID=A0ABY3UXE8_MYCLN|nr:serine/threonine-protein kinase PknD [Mycobacterium lentiflavum]MEE3067258.1 serine/threonine-protein kinase PknD [Actinomycetota bacterium]ULP44260.1 serine/threonine-protein kinase PknD [Mycobacterium lentiflavum]